MFVHWIFLGVAVFLLLTSFLYLLDMVVKIIKQKEIDKQIIRVIIIICFGVLGTWLFLDQTAKLLAG